MSIFKHVDISLHFSNICLVYEREFIKAYMSLIVYFQYDLGKACYFVIKVEITLSRTYFLYNFNNSNP